MTPLSNVKTSPKWSFNGRHNQLSGMNVPGPGSYTSGAPDVTSKTKRAPGFAFGSASREVIDKQRVPGPGSYAHRNHIGSEGTAFSCTPRRAKGSMGGTNDYHPGPGSHELPSLVGRHGPQYSATPRRTDARKAAVPGPGAYDHQDAALIQGQAKYSFGTATRPGIEAVAERTPGPGTYNHKDSVGLAVKYSMQSRREGVKPQVTPGPGHSDGPWTTFGY